MSQIVDLLLDRLVRDLTISLMNNIPPGTPYRANVVKKGMNQENKLQKPVVLNVSGGDHEDPNYRDGIVTLSDLPNIAWKVPAREVGGGAMWWRRGIVHIDAYFVSAAALNEDNAHEYAYEILGLVENTIDNAYVADLMDTYGERAQLMFCFGNTFFESGGPPVNYIFRGKVFWTALTERP